MAQNSLKNKILKKFQENRGIFKNVSNNIVYLFFNKILRIILALKLM